MANRFAQYAVPQPAPPAPAPQWQPSNRFGHYIEPTNPAWQMDDTPIPDAKTRYNDSMLLKYGPQQWAAAQADAARVGNAARTKVPAGLAFLNGTALGWAPEALGSATGWGTSVQNALAKTGIVKPAGYSADAARDATTQALHDAQDEWAAKHPIANTALSITGSLPTLEGLGAGRFVKGAKTFTGATGRSAIVGGLTGATSGAGENYGDRLQGALWGGGTGLALGAGLPAATAVTFNGVKAVPRLARGVKQAAGALKEAVGLPQGEVAPTPTSDAQALDFLRKVATSRGITPDSIAADPRVQAGLPVKTANLIGKRGVNLATGLAKGPGDAADILDPVAHEQIRSTAPGVVSDFQSLSGIDPNAAHGDVVAQAAEGRAKAAPLYTKAYANTNVTSPTLQALLPRLQATGALQKALKIAQIEGRNPMDLGFTTKTVQMPGGGSMDQVVSLESPSMQTWDYVKRGMDDVLEQYRDPTTRRLNLTTQGRAEMGLLGKLRDELTNPQTAWGPDYKAALDAGGDPIRLEQAFNEGSRLIKNNVKPRDFQARWNSYSPAEQQSFMGGFADDLNNQLGAGKLRPKDLLTDWSRQKLGTMFGDQDTADDFLNRVQMRSDLAKEAARYTPGTNSPTAEANAANEEMSQGGPFWSELAQKPNLEGLIGAAGKLAVAPVRGFVTGFGAPLSPEARLSFANMMMSDPDTFRSMLTGAPKPPPVPSIVPPAAAPTAGLLGGATAYGAQSQ